MKKSFISKHTRNPNNGDIRLISPYSYGKAVPRGGSLQACLCKDQLTYSRKCCEGYLINQGIGNITGTVVTRVGRPWSSGFSSAFGPVITTQTIE
jgi:hypothetical protein